MRLIIRADASRLIGTGHVMRSLAIAESAINQGIECVFAGTLGDIAWLENVVADVGFTQVIRTADLLEIFNKSDVLVLDSYSFSESWILDLPWRGKVAVVDPFTPDFQVDIRLHPGLESEWPSNNKSVFLGDGRYLLVRKAFREIELKSKRNKPPREILVIGGGSDPFHFCRSLSRELTTFSGDFNFNVITDLDNFLLNDSRFTFYPAGDNFLKLIVNTDLVFSPASTTAIEVLASGLPLGVVCAAENQNSNYQNLTSAGFAIGIGQRSLDGVWAFNRTNIQLLLESKSLTNFLREKCSKNFDLLGADRFVTYIMAKYK